ncbi:hypothetical protein [Ulvibacter litoralis]|uniref:Uncharacterized protein n=1 Tax=Ulvibacter litoralis TaxID=227084 RepID=A0A1G7JB89_9FLAO|nr:hypothetical protein [Ulvibacter litoralis]GHC64528.1 hypothetical protein GCM10008083_32190 [Ulvibacter litoralis]SDF22237.1 hypothetical protein SAMN05421855_11021 [Ulvibacter litoralis]
MIRDVLLKDFTLHEVYETKNCTFWFYDVLCWFEAKEEVLFTLEGYVDEMLVRFDKYYNNQPIPFISNRINTYSFNLLDSVKFPEFIMISCFMTICYGDADVLHAKFAKQFWKKPFIILESPKKAVEYLTEALKSPATICK